MARRLLANAALQLPPSKGNHFVCPMISPSSCYRFPNLNLDGHPFFHKSQCLIFGRAVLLIPRVKLKQDRGLDRVMDREKILRPVINIRDLIMKSTGKTIPIRFFTLKKRELGLKMSVAKIQKLIERYPNIIEIYNHPKDKQQWCRLTKEAMGLIEEEKTIHIEQKQVTVEKLSKLLMMSNSKKIPVYKFELSKRYFGLPDDFRRSILLKYPDIFRLVSVNEFPSRRGDRKPMEYLELVKWDESLAISQHEKNAKEQARQKGLGEIDTRGRSLPFKFQYSAGMALRKKVLEKYEQWQKLPYISPYEDGRCAPEGSILGEKRVVALMHELLSLTIEKRTEIKVIGLFREEYNLPSNFVRLMNRFPGIFYICLKGAVYTVLLRECYDRSRLIEENPFVQLKSKYTKMVHLGPIVRSRLWMSRGRKGYEVSSASEEDLSDELSDEDDEQSDELSDEEDELSAREDDDNDSESDLEDEEREMFLGVCNR